MTINVDIQKFWFVLTKYGHAIKTGNSGHRSAKLYTRKSEATKLSLRHVDSIVVEVTGTIEGSF